MNIIQSAFGRYEVTGSPSEGECVVGHSFGTLTGEGSVNRLLADYIDFHAEGRPIVADRMLADAFDHTAIDEVVEGQISNGVGQGVGSWGTLLSAKEFMAREGLNTALMVGQAFHIGRISLQADKLSMVTVIPAGLPTNFDPESEQRWTRSKSMWVPREVLGSLVLKAQNKL